MNPHPTPQVARPAAGRGLRSASLTFALLAPLLATSQPPATLPAPAPSACGIAPWTGSCACSVPGAVVPFARYAALLQAAGGEAAEAALRAERRSCGFPDRRAATTRSAAMPTAYTTTLPPG
jgi:hypothetical protein